MNVSGGRVRTFTKMKAKRPDNNQITINCARCKKRRWWVCVYKTESLQQYKRVLQLAFRHCVLQSLLNGIKVAGWSFDCIRQMRAIFPWENCHLIKLPSTLVQAIEWQPSKWASERERAREEGCGNKSKQEEERVRDKSGCKNIRCKRMREHVIGVLVLCCKLCSVAVHC